MERKKGISLVVLGITLVVVIALASTVIFVSNETFVNSRMAAFEMDLKSIEDLIEEYYINNNKLPVEEDVIYDKTDLLDLIEIGVEFLEEEIGLNGDNAEKFRVIKMKELSIKGRKRVEEFYDFDKNVLKMRETYEEIMEKKSEFI